MLPDAATALAPGGAIPRPGTPQVSTTQRRPMRCARCGRFMIQRSRLVTAAPVYAIGLFAVAPYPIGDCGVTSTTLNVRDAGMPGYVPVRAPIVSVDVASFHSIGIRVNSPRSYPYDRPSSS